MIQTATRSAASGLPRSALIAAGRNLNTSLDRVFYDVNSLTAGERDLLATYDGPEGAIVIVHPGAAAREIEIVAPAAFVAAQSTDRGPAVDTVVVAGVGSSALGTAALARDVADFTQRPVAGIVSGMGVADVIAEAAGGWFVFVARNTVRDALARVFDALHLRDHVRDDATHRAMEDHFDQLGLTRDRFIFGSPDSAALLFLLTTLGGRIRLLVGHSKGNYSIENALEGCVEAQRATGIVIDPALCVVTLGAVARFPDHFTNVHQFLGTIDLLGLLNSQPLVKRERIPGAWHSTNEALRGHLSVAETLARVAAG